MVQLTIFASVTGASLWTILFLLPNISSQPISNNDEYPCGQLVCCLDCSCCGVGTSWSSDMKSCVTSSWDTKNEECGTADENFKCYSPECVGVDCCGLGTVLTPDPLIPERCLCVNSSYDIYPSLSPSPTMAPYTSGPTVSPRPSFMPSESSQPTSKCTCSEYDLKQVYSRGNNGSNKGGDNLPELLDYHKQNGNKFYTYQTWTYVVDVKISSVSCSCNNSKCTGKKKVALELTMICHTWGDPRKWGFVLLPITPSKETKDVGGIPRNWSVETNFDAVIDLPAAQKGNAAKKIKNCEYKMIAEHEIPCTAGKHLSRFFLHPTLIKDPEKYGGKKGYQHKGGFTSYVDVVTELEEKEACKLTYKSVKAFLFEFNPTYKLAKNDPNLNAKILKESPTIKSNLHVGGTDFNIVKLISETRNDAEKPDKIDNEFPDKWLGSNKIPNDDCSPNKK